jgi:sec-independent protein translocase protein TatA
MAFDDPIVWILVLAVVIFLFGANKIPQFAKSIGQAKKEWDQASKAITNPATILDNSQPASSAAISTSAAQSALVKQAPLPNTPANDPLIAAAQKEGIDTQGKTRDQIATEIAWKLKSK